VWNAHNTVFGSRRSAVCAQAIYFLHSTRPSVTWLNSRWSLATCDWLISGSSAVLSTRVGRRRKFQEVFCTECTGQGNKFKLIPTVKMETRNPVEGYFSSEFPAICNHIAEFGGLKSQDIKEILRNLCVFGKKRPLIVKFSKFCSESFYRDIDRRFVFKFREIWPTENRWNRTLLTWLKYAWLSSCRYCADRTENLLGPAPPMYSVCSRFRPNWFTVDGVIAERVNIAKTRRKGNPIFGWSLASSRIITKVQCDD